MQLLQIFRTVFRDIDLILQFDFPQSIFKANGYLS